MAATSLSTASDDTLTTLSFNEIDLSQREAWDDTELIKAYDRAITTYRMMHGPMSEGAEGEEWEEEEEEELMYSVRAGSDLEAAEQAQLAQRAAAEAVARIEAEAEAEAAVQAEAFAEAEAEAKALAWARARATASADQLAASSLAAAAPEVRRTPQLTEATAGHNADAAAADTTAQSADSMAEEVAEAERLLAWDRYYEACGWEKGPMGWQVAAAAPHGSDQYTAAGLPGAVPNTVPDAVPDHSARSMPAPHVPVATAAASMGATGAEAHETDLSNLILAWYHCGFFTAKYQERYSGGRG